MWGGLGMLGDRVLEFACSQWSLSGSQHVFPAEPLKVKSIRGFDCAPPRSGLYKKSFRDTGLGIDTDLLRRTLKFARDAWEITSFFRNY